MYTKDKLFRINSFAWIKPWMGEVPCGIFSPYHMKRALTRTLFGTLCMANNAESGLPLVLYIYIHIGMNAHFSSLILKKVGRENVICYEYLH